MKMSQARALTVEGQPVEIAETVEGYGDAYHRVVKNSGEELGWVAESAITREEE